MHTWGPQRSKENTASLELKWQAVVDGHVDAESDQVFCKSTECS